MIVQTPLFSKAELAEIQLELRRIQDAANKEILSATPDLHESIRERCKEDCALFLSKRERIRRSKNTEAFIWSEAVAVIILCFGFLFEIKLMVLLGIPLFLVSLTNAIWKSSEGYGHPVLHRAVLSFCCFVAAVTAFNFPQKTYNPGEVYVRDSKRNGITIRQDVYSGQELIKQQEAKTKSNKSVGTFLCFIGGGFALSTLHKSGLISSDKC